MTYLTYGDGMLTVTEIHMDLDDYEKAVAAARDAGYMEGHEDGWHAGFDCATEMRTA